MDWGEQDPAASPQDVPEAQLVETYWRAIGSHDNELYCGLYRTAMHYELRCGRGSDLLRARKVERTANPRTLASAWLAMLLWKGGFTVVESTVDEELHDLVSLFHDAG